MRRSRNYIEQEGGSSDLAQGTGEAAAGRIPHAAHGSGGALARAAEGAGPQGSRMRGRPHCPAGTIALMVVMAAGGGWLPGVAGEREVRVVGVPGATAEEIRAIVRRTGRAVEEELGLRLPAAVDVRVVGSREELRQLGGGATGELALALAVPSKGLIAVNRTGVVPGTRDALAVVLGHELVHLALGAFGEDGAAARRIPLWFEEGLATLWGARVMPLGEEALGVRAAAGTTIPLAALDERFPEDEAEMRLAYLQSESAVRYLCSGWGRGAPRRVLDRMRRGEPFEGALRAETGLSPEGFEEAWQRWLLRWDRIAGMLTSQRAILLYAAVLAAAAYAIDRRRRRRRPGEAGEAAGTAREEEGGEGRAA